MNAPSKVSDPPRVSAYVSRVTPEINDALADFFHAIWGSEGTGDEVAAARAAAASNNPTEPGIEVPEFVFLLNEKVIGYLGTVPVSFWNGRVETPTYWLKGFMVHPDHRNGPVGFNLLKEALKTIGPSGAIAAAPAARRLFTAVGFAECGPIPNFVSVLRPSRFMSLIDLEAFGSHIPKPAVRTLVLAQRAGLMKVAGAIAWLAQGAWKGAHGEARTGYQLQCDGVLPASAELNALWTAARSDMKSAAVRDGTFLPWRYHPARGDQYEAASVRDGTGRLVAVAVVRKPAEAGDERLRGVKVAVLSDVLFTASDAAAGAVVLRGAEQIALRMGADALLCSATAPDVKRALRRRAYLSIPANVFLLVRDPGGSLGLSAKSDDWWVTRGDCKADDAF